MKDLVKIETLPLIENLAKAGMSQADIGMMLGFSGTDARSWFQRLCKKYPSIEKAYHAGKDIADTALIASAYQRAMFGYEWEEEEIEYAVKECFDRGTDTVILKDIPVSRKVKKRRKAPDNGLLRFLIMNRIKNFKDDCKEETNNVKQVESVSSLSDVLFEDAKFEEENENS